MRKCCIPYIPCQSPLLSTIILNDTCDESISRGGVSTKNYNTSNLRYHLWREHPAKFDELGVKEAEKSKRNEAEKSE